MVRLTVMVVFWASLVACWVVFYKVRPIPFLRNTFTMHRWAVNPWQLYTLFMLMQVSLNQIVIGVPPNGPQEFLARSAQIALAACNFLGSVICAYGVHLRDTNDGQLFELAGYLSLCGSLGIYVYLVFTVQPLPNTSYGLALSEAFLFASLHRAIQIGFARWSWPHRVVELVVRCWPWGKADE